MTPPSTKTVTKSTRSRMSYQKLPFVITANLNVDLLQ